MLLTVLRFNFASPQGEPRTQSELLRAALELAQWGESRGITTVSVDEHHATGHGWSCNPIMAAAMLLARTSTLIASVDCTLGPLWNPVRLAEDIALVDNMSRGRLHTTVGLGYRTVEYDSLGVDFSRRGLLMDSLIERMLSVWSGAEQENGVCTGTWTRPHPPLYVGGGSRITARRAARFRLPLSLADHLPDIADLYRELCAEVGIAPLVIMPGPINRGMIYLHEDPDRAWAELPSSQRVYAATLKRRTEPGLPRRPCECSLPSVTAPPGSSCMGRGSRLTSAADSFTLQYKVRGHDRSCVHFFCNDGVVSLA